MNDFSQLETQLKSLKPANPSEDFLARIERELNEPGSTATAAVFSTRRGIQFNWRSLGWGLAAAATALFLLLLVKVDRPARKNRALASATPAVVAPSMTGQDQFIPTGLTRVVYHTRDEGLYFPSGAQRPVRRTRSITRETFVWHNPTTGASLRVSYPSDEVSFTPVSGQ
jgi:hypothetical protein